MSARRDSNVGRRVGDVGSDVGEGVRRERSGRMQVVNESGLEPPNV